MSSPERSYTTCALLDAIAAHVVLCEVPEAGGARLVGASRSLCGMTGLAAPARESLRIENWLPPPTGMVLGDAVVKAARCGNPAHLEGVGDFPKGRFSWRAAMLPLAGVEAGADGRLVAVTFTRIDPAEGPADAGTIEVVERKALEAALEAARREAVEARMQAEEASRTKSQFLAHVSHELRTPLNAIMGFAEIMRGEYFGPLGANQYREYVGDIVDSGRHLLDLVNDIIDLSRIESGCGNADVGEVDLARLAQDAARLLRERAAAKGVALILRLEPVPNIRAELRGLKQVAINLLTNAVKFTPRGGRVELATRHEADGTIALTVRDTGIGIPAGEVSRVLEAFAQASNAHQADEAGSGLGLTIVRSILERLGAVFHIDSAVGRGTTVVVRIPAERLVDGSRAPKPWEVVGDA
jgi:signal transduction histidine kinase